MERFLKKVNKTNSCWLWTGCKTSRGDYGEVRVNKVLYKAHRHSYVLHKGEIPAEKVVRHKCDVGLCVNPDHLELGTQADNVRDMIERGRKGKGHFSILKETDIPVIKQMRNDGLTLREIGEHFGVHLSTITKSILNSQ